MIPNEQDGPVEKLWRIDQWFPDIPDSAREMLRVYHQELLKFNAKINLISRRTEANADQVHFADSIMASKLLLNENKSSTIFDIGSGNGFPGLVLALLSPERQIVLVDKDSRKIEFLKHMIAKMNLSNVSTHTGLLDELPPDSIECGISRGFASLSGAIIGSRKQFKVEGEYFHMKGTIWAREMAEIPTQVCSIWSPRLLSDYKLPDSPIVHSLVVTKKIAK